MHMLMLLIVMLSIQLSPMPAQAQATPPAAQAQAIKYLDVTTDQAQGWALAQTTAASASRGKRVVIISYLDPQQTRALYDTAVRFMEKSAQTRVVGVIRSPGVPANVTETEKNPLGFDVFFDGAMLTRNTNPDPRFSRLDHLDANLRSIQGHYFTGQGR